MNYIQEGWKPGKFISKYMYTMLVKLKFLFQINISKIIDRHPHPHFYIMKSADADVNFSADAYADVTHITSIYHIYSLKYIYQYSP